MALRTVGVRLTAEVSSYMSNMRRAGASTKEFVGETKRAADSGHLDHVADRAGAVGIALTGMAAYAIKSAADFDKSMSAVSAATHGSAAEIGQLRAAALQAGKDTQYSATGAADAITELSKAGVSTADVLGGGLKGALSLAAAGQLDVGEAAETAASAMTQFKLSGKDIPHIADLLAAGAGKAQGSVHDMGAALNQSGLVAAQFGLSIEDTTGVLAEFAHAGLMGSDAGTSLKTMLLAIANPSKQTRDLMAELGISFYDAQGKFIGLSGVAQVLQTRLAGLTESQRQQALGQLFGNDAIRSASILYTDGAAGVKEWATAVNASGYASDTAAKLTDNLAGDLERLKGSVETLAIEAGGGANGGLRLLVKALEGVVDRFGALPSVVGSGITVLAGLGGAAALLGAGWVKLRRNTADVLEELRSTGPAGERAAAGLSTTTKWAGRAALAFGALQVAAVAIDAATGDMNPQIDALATGLEKFSSTGHLSGEAARLLGGDMGKLDGAMKDVADTGRWSSFSRGFGSAIESFTGTGHAFDDSLTNSRERLQAVDQALQQLVQGGNSQQAAQIFKTITDRAAEQGVSVNELKKVLPGYAASLETVGKSSKGAAGATGDLNSALQTGAAEQNKYKTQADAVAGAARGEREALGALYSALKAQTDPVFALIDSQQKLKDAQAAAAKAIKEHRSNSSQARAADLDLAKAALDLQMNVGNLSSTFNGKLDPAFRTTLRNAGLTSGQIKVVENSFKDAKVSADKYAGKYEAKASAPGAKGAKKELDDAYTSAHHLDGGRYEAKTSAPGAKQAKTELDKAYTAANNFAGPYRATVSVTGAEAAEAKLKRLSIYQQALKSGKIPAGFNGPIKGPDGKYYADGGWTGPGGKYDEAGTVHADEFVIKKESRRKIEARAPGMLDEMNATGQVPGYADGGRVWPYPVTAAGTRVPSQAEAMAAVTPTFGGWPSSPGAQRGDSGVWHKILALVKASGIPYEFGNSYRPGDPLWHGSGRAIDFMGYNQDRLAKFFMARQSQVLELIHRTKSQDYGITRGHYNAMPTQWPLHRNHLHIAMKNGGTITEPIMGVGASGRTYSFGENYQPERVTPNWQGGGGGGGGTINVTVQAGYVVSEQDLENKITRTINRLQGKGRV